MSTLWLNRISLSSTAGFPKYLYCNCIISCKQITSLCEKTCRFDANFERRLKKTCLSLTEISQSECICHGTNCYLTEISFPLLPSDIWSAIANNRSNFIRLMLILLAHKLDMLCTYNILQWMSYNFSSMMYIYCIVGHLEHIATL